MAERTGTSDADVGRETQNPGGSTRELPDSREAARETLDPRDPRDLARELPDPRDSERLAALVQEVAELRRAAEAKDLLLSASALVAHTLQHSLLPDALPEVPGVQFASAYHPVGEGAEVGGDFYDVFEVPSGCWLVVGDVCGKGIEAAAVTALVRHSIRALALHQDSPAQVLRSVNDAMLSHELALRFATAVLARLDLSRASSAGPVPATIASAGHPPPVLVGADGRTCCPEVSGTMLGVVREASSHDVRVTLEPGASVVLYTDGLTDAGAPRTTIAPEELCSHLARGGPCEPRATVARLEELAGARSGGRLRDDIAIVAARVEQ
jgi:sigma-B regulation protein RsbU (phosphoserine phosphatase)